MSRTFDTIVITAANEAQAAGYEAQVAALRGHLAPEILVIPDPGGKRVGSLGSTVCVLRALGGRKTKERVLICHSGGDAKRLPAYAALGKAFVTMDDGRSLFEHIVELMARLPSKPGVVVCCGDVIPRLDATKVEFADAGVTGVAYPDGPWQAQRHGVYVTGDRRLGLKSVVDFLQKPQVARGRFLIDTGILHIDWPTALKMRKLPVEGDIYEAFPKMLLEGYAPFHASVVSRCEFFHVGSSRELLTLLGREGTLVDACQAPLAKLGGENIVTYVPASYGPVSLARGECLTCLPLGAEAWCPLKYRIDDDFKKDGTWERLKLGELMTKVNHRRLLALRDEACVELPLRIDLAGGWSDTPPICCEMGGRVLNAAVLLQGVKPVKARVRRIAQPEVRVASVDLGKKGVLTSMAEIRAPKDPHDWCALVKSALTVTGYNLKEGGLDIRISAEVPKGSGLGTSSILGAALVKALLMVRQGRQEPDWRQVAELTLQLEQEMQTGGGWEDQVGALVPGVKIFDTKPGREQNFSVRRLPAAAEAAFAKFLDERALLYFTGQKRMARNVLRGVLNFFRENPENIAHEIINRIKRDAEKAFGALKKGDWDAFCTAVNGYWLSKKALDPGSTNPLVESIIARVAPWTAAVTICGAGGGGFILLIANDAVAKAKMREVLVTYPPVATGRPYDFAIARE